MTWLEERFRVLTNKLQERLGYTFSSRELMEQALTHRSFANEEGGGSSDNERLEFLGDAVLELQVSHRLYFLFPDMSEGELSRARAAIVRGESLRNLSEELELGELLRLGRGEEQTGGRRKTSVLADAFEALIGAIYLDGGLEKVDAVIEALMGDLIHRPAEELTQRDPKSLLQEKVQEIGVPSPTYELVSEDGPEHDKRFRVAAVVSDSVLAEGIGASKKEAAGRAAAEALERMEAGEVSLEDLTK